MRWEGQHGKGGRQGSARELVGARWGSGWGAPALTLTLTTRGGRARRTSCLLCEHLSCSRLSLVLVWAGFSSSGRSSSAAPRPRPDIACRGPCMVVGCSRRGVEAEVEGVRRGS
eukprot:scaffold119087_cov60-Phaeocystis_antarctica.AAC.3